MKKVILTAFAALGISISAFSQKFFERVSFVGAFPQTGTSYTAITEGGFQETFSTGNWTEDWTEWFPKTKTYLDPTETKSGDISSDVTWSGTVAMSGTIHVKSGATLTIAAGTIIRCRTGSTLIISKGSKINAIGTKTSPIVFTSDKASGSRAPGDWAGILIIGNSQVNTSSGKRQYEALPTDPLAEYGGGRGAELNLNDNSGEMRFVRIEFAGFNYLPDQELNGLTLGAVGAGTKINFIQVSYARDDSFEWFGGTSNHKYLVAFAGVDDDFDMDEGYAGKGQFFLGVRNPSVFETAAGGTSNGFEHDNNTGLGSASQVVPGVNNPTPETKPIVSNVSLIGPWATATQASKPGHKFGRGLEMRSAVATSIYNSIITGYGILAQLVHPTATITPSVSTKLTAGECVYTNVHLIGNTGNGSFTFPTTAANAPVAFNFGTYLSNNGGTTSTNNSGVEFQSIISDFETTSNGISYAPKSTSTIAGLSSNFGGLIDQFSGTAAELGSLPSFSVSKPSLNFGTKEVGNTFASITFDVAAANLTGTGFTLSSSSTAFSVSPATLPNTGGTVTIGFASATALNGTTNISIVPNDSRLVAISIPAQGKLVNPLSPRINTNLAALNFSVLETTTSSTYTSIARVVSVTGRLLRADITATAPTGYEISTTESGTYSNSLVLAHTMGAINAVIFVKLASTIQSSTNAGNLSFASTGAPTAIVALSANTNPAFTVGSATLDYFTGNIISTTSARFNVRGDRLPATVLITANSPEIEISADSPISFGPSFTLNTGGRITSTGNNIRVRYIGTMTGTSAGNQVGVISVAGVGNTIPFVLRLNAVNTVTQQNFILADAASNVITGLGFSFSDVISGTPHLYTTSNALIGFVSSIGTSTATLTGNSLVSTNIVNTAVTFPGFITTDVNSDIITGTGTNFINLPTGLPIHLPDGTLVGKVSGALNTTLLLLQSTALVTTITSDFRTSAIYYRRPTATLSISPSSPLIFNVSSYDVNGNPNPVTQFITITGANHNVPLNVGINPALTSSGYMFEITNTPGVFSTTLGINSNGSIRQVLEIRYIPTNVTSFSLIGQNVNAAHSTELLILGNNRTLAQGANSSDPRATIAFNLRGNAQPSLTLDVPSLSKFNALTGVASEIKMFKITGSRVLNVIMISAPANFELSKTTDFTGASNMLNFTTSSPTVSQDIYVRYKNNIVTNETGSISIASAGIASLSVNVEAETSGTPFININTPSSSNTISFTGNSMFTVSGNNLTEAIVVSVTSSGFEISSSQTGTYSSSISLSPSPADFGNVAQSIIFVRATNATVTSNGMISASTKNVTTEMLTIINVNTVTTSIINIIEDKNANVIIYPNPTEGDATLEVETLFSENISVIVYNITGTIFKSFTSKVNGLETFTINGLEKGLYFVRVQTGNSVKTVKLIIK